MKSEKDKPYKKIVNGIKIFISFTWLRKFINWIGNILISFLSWIKESFRILIYIAGAAFFIGFLTFFSISYFHQDNKKQNQVEQKDVAQKDVKLNPVEYLIKSFKYEKPIDTTASNVSAKDTIINKIPQKGIIDKILDHSSNILGKTSIIINFLILLLTIILVVGGFAIYKYIKEFIILRDGVEAARNSVLDSALTTISAVPLIEATQITSESYYWAIETIKDAVIENRNNISKNPKYCELLIVEALFYWNKRQYSQTVKILKDALNLAYKGSKINTVKTISYHLARAYKQWAYETNKDKYFEEAENYAKNTFPEQEKVINLSISSIRYSLDKANKDEIKTALANCIGIGKEDITNIKKNKIKITDFASWTAFTVIALIEKDEIAKENVREYCAGKSLMLVEEKLYSFAGNNIKASWYNTASKLANIVRKIFKINTKKYKEMTDKMNTYNSLYVFYQKQAEDKNENFKVFDSVLLIENES